LLFPAMKPTDEYYAAAAANAVKDVKLSWGWHGLSSFTFGDNCC
jgi:hypothetical protein